MDRAYTRIHARTQVDTQVDTQEIDTHLISSLTKFGPMLFALIRGVRVGSITVTVVVPMCTPSPLRSLTAPLLLCLPRRVKFAVCLCGRD